MSDRAGNDTKKPKYSPPILSIYGGIANLTASGSIIGMENSGSMANEKG